MCTRQSVLLLEPPSLPQEPKTHSLCFLTTSPHPPPVLSKLNFNGSHNMLYFSLRCEFCFFESLSGWLHFLTMSNSEMSFVSWHGGGGGGEQEDPKMSVNRLGGTPLRLLCHSSRLEQPYWVDLKGLPPLLSLTCPQGCGQKPRCMGASEHTPSSGCRFQKFPKHACHALAPSIVPGG